MAPRVLTTRQPLLTVREAATYLRVSPKTLFNQRARGAKPGALGFRLGGRAVRFDPAELEDWVNEQRTNQRGL